MKIWYNNVLGSQMQVAEVISDRVRIGRAAHNDIVLDSPLIAPDAALLERVSSGWQLTATGARGCEISGVQIAADQRIELPETATISLFPFNLTISSEDLGEETEATTRTQLDEQMSGFVRDMHVELLARMEVNQQDDREITDEYLLILERNIEEIARSFGVGKRQNHDFLAHVSAHCVRSELAEWLIDRAERSAAKKKPPKKHWSELVSTTPDREQELQTTVMKLASSLCVAAYQDLSDAMDAVDRDFWQEWERHCSSLFAEFLLYLTLRHFKKQIKDIVFGYGPLEDLLRTPTINEIMVVRRDQIYIEKGGVLENSGRQFISDEVTVTIIERIVSKVGRRIDKSQPIVDARLADGSRVNAVIPPIAVEAPLLTIRKFPLERMTIDHLIEFGSLTETVAHFLHAAVAGRCNILIAGGTGTGKTTLLNCLSDYIPNKERIVTIEDTAELQLHKEHVCRMETKQANVEGAGAYEIRDLVKNSLRMRPDRIVVGECRGPEALDMLQAMNTGHDGSMTTIHANSAEDVVRRLEVMVQMAADLPVHSIHHQIASAVDLIVQLTRFSDGSRRVTQISEVAGVDENFGGIRTKDIYLASHSDNGQLAPTGGLPSFMPALLNTGLIQLDACYL